MILSTNHVSFTVSNIDTSISFYRDILGFTIESIRYDVTADYVREVTCYPNLIIHIAFLNCPGCRLELMQYVEPLGINLDKSTANIGSGHLAFNVADIFVAYNLLREKGVVFKSAPVRISNGPHEGGYAVYSFDPDGLSVELLQLP